ncbi:hypothetical protein H7992_00650 [Sporosarcina sp. resist]|uniref:hypothetical protein n=1 Tax=Sporosarcina sp. resist TaxID=2762563 RepID=UPI00164E7488|nr:hypothetical protein [Sporosarcina sp. resist]QNK88340.1 hypothetical protein H7992_00650 [Sporosarcina sp. resist]
MRELDFKHDLILIFLNEKKYIYNSYDIMLVLSVNYEMLNLFFEDLFEHELIVKDKVVKRYILTKLGLKRLKEHYLNNFDLDAFLNLEFTDSKVVKQRNLSHENIVYIPNNFEK